MRKVCKIHKRNVNYIGKITDGITKDNLYLCKQCPALISDKDLIEVK